MYGEFPVQLGDSDPGKGCLLLPSSGNKNKILVKGVSPSWRESYSFIHSFKY